MKNFLKFVLIFGLILQNQQVFAQTGFFDAITNAAKEATKRLSEANQAMQGRSKSNQSQNDSSTTIATSADASQCPKDDALIGLPMLSADVDSVHKNYFSNSMAFEERFFKKNIEISGTLLNVSKIDNQNLEGANSEDVLFVLRTGQVKCLRKELMVTLRGKSINNTSTCTFTNPNAALMEKALQLKAGDAVKFNGIWAEKMGPISGFQLTNCSFK